MYFFKIYKYTKKIHLNQLRHYICVPQGEKTAVIICKYLTIDIEPDDMKQVDTYILPIYTRR